MFTINFNIWGFLSVIMSGIIIIVSIILIIKNYRMVEFNKRNGILKLKKNTSGCDNPCEIHKFSSIVIKAFNYGKKLEIFDSETIREQLTFSDNTLDNIVQRMSDKFLEMSSKILNKTEAEINQSLAFYYFLSFIELIINKIKWQIKNDLKEDVLMEFSDKKFNMYKKEKCESIRSKFNSSRYNVLYQSNLELTHEVLEELKITFFDIVELELDKILDNARGISIEKNAEKEKLIKEIDDFYLQYTGQDSKNFISDLNC